MRAHRQQIRRRRILGSVIGPWLTSAPVVALGVMGIVSPALATDRTWDGFTSNQFSLGTNWTQAIAPGSSDKAIFVNHSTIKRSLVILTADYTVSAMDVSGVPSTDAFEFQRQGAASLTVSNGLRCFGTSSPMTFNGFHVNCGSLQTTSSAVVNLTNDAVITTPGQASVQTSSTLNITSATVNAANFAVGNSGVVNINAGGSISVGGQIAILDTTSQININSGGALQYNGSASLLAGTLTVSGTGTLNIGTTVLEADGPALIQFNRNFSLPAGKTLSIQSAGDLASTDYVDIATGGTGTLLANGAGSTVSVGTNTTSGYSYWGLNNAATITFSNFATGDYNGGIQAGIGAGANARVNINTSASLNVDGSLTTGTGGGIASITIDSATLTSTGTSNFGSNTTIAVQNGGTLGFSGDATFSTGSTLNWTGGTVNFGAGKTFNINGGAINNSSSGWGLPNGTTLRITNSGGVSGGTGGQFNNSSYFDIANGVGTGTMLVDGADSLVTTNGVTASDWGRSTGNIATVTFSNGGTGIYYGLRISTNGGTTRLTLSDGGRLGVATLQTGSSSVGSNASITINNGGLNVTGNGTFSGGTQIAYNSGSLIVMGTLDMSSNAQILLQPGGDKFVQVGFLGVSGTLAMSGTSKIDLADNALLNLYIGSSPISTIAGYVKTGSSNSWSGNALTSSTARTVALDAANPHKTGLGYIQGTLNGQADVVVAYTYLGDANLDQIVNALDFNALATNYGKTGKFWSDGDFTYDGSINSADFDKLAANFGQTMTSPPAPVLEALGSGELSQLVPEPATIPPLFALGALLRRRRS